MSHSLVFVRYVNGKRAPYDLTKLRSILTKYGAEIGPARSTRKGASEYFVGFPAHDDGDDISGEESGIYFDSGGVLEFAIGRPIYGERLKQLSFELLQSFDVCMHPDFGEEVFTISQEAQHIPEELLQSCEKGLTVVKDPSDLW